MHSSSPSTGAESVLKHSGPGEVGGWPEPAAWRTLDEGVTLIFEQDMGVGGGAVGASAPCPSALRWRGSVWRVVGPARRWTTWHAFAVESEQLLPPTSRSFRVSFYRFTAQTNPVSPVFHFEVRGTGEEWRLVRLGAVFDLPAQP